MRLTDMHRVNLLRALFHGPLILLLFGGATLWMISLPYDHFFIVLIVGIIALGAMTFDRISPRLKHFFSAYDQFHKAYTYNDGEPVDVQILPVFDYGPEEEEEPTDVEQYEQDVQDGLEAPIPGMVETAEKSDREEED